MAFAIPVRRTSTAIQTVAQWAADLPEGGLTELIPSDGNRAWVTPILGSGCTATPTHVEALVEHAERVQCATARMFPGQSLRGLGWSAMVGEFLATLIQDRTRVGLTDGQRSRLGLGAPDHDGRPDDWLVYLSIITALLTSLYHHIKAAVPSAPKRPDHEDAAEIPPGSPLRLDVEVELLEPCKALMNQFRDDLLGAVAAGLVGGVESVDDGADQPGRATDLRDKIHASVDGLVGRVVRDLSVDGAGSVIVRQSQLRSLAEFVWLGLTNGISGVTVYPGWSDLLVDLGSFEHPPEQLGQRPQFEELTSAHQYVRGRYRRLALESMSRSTDAIPLVSSVASLLTKQTKTGDGFPRAAAFSTSFDLELATSMARRDRPFNLALPVHVVDKLDEKRKRAYPTWIACKVEGIEELRRLVANLSSEGTQPEWRLLAKLLQDRSNRFPTIVHLAGCPLVTPPRLVVQPTLRAEVRRLLGRSLRLHRGIDDLKEELRKPRLDAVMGGLEFQHAVVMTEHDAVTQAALDILKVSNDTEALGESYQPWDDPPATRGLPFVLAGGVETPPLPGSMGLTSTEDEESDQPRGWDRYWMLFGVQVRDSAIRHRIASLVSSLRVSEQGSDRANDVPIGVAFVSFLSDLSTDTLAWSGLEVVSGSSVDVNDPDLLSLLRQAADAYGDLR